MVLSQKLKVEMLLRKFYLIIKGFRLQHLKL